MNQIEQIARQSHGNLMYSLTWRARKSDNKWLWVLVAVIALLQLTWQGALAGAFAGAFSSFILYGDTPTIFPAAGVGAVMWAFLSPVTEAILNRKNAFRNTSNFIAIAGDMLRVKGSSHNPLSRLIAKLGYLMSGAIAMYCALSIYLFNKRRLHTLAVTELDVLGNALSKGGFWTGANKVFDVLHAHYCGASLRLPSEVMQVAVSYALACKWMLRKPGMDAAEKEHLKAIIQYVMEKYKLPQEVTMRLNEALV